MELFQGDFAVSDLYQSIQSKFMKEEVGSKTIWTCLGNTVDELNDKTLNDMMLNVTHFSKKGDLLAVLWLREQTDIEDDPFSPVYNYYQNVKSLKEMSSYVGAEWMLDNDVVQCGKNNLGVFKRL